MLPNLVSISTASDPKAEILKLLGSAVDAFSVLGDRVLVATYIRAEKTKGGILLPGTQRDEDRYQGKVGLILKKGPTAFKYDGSFPYEGDIPNDGQWVVYRTSDTWEFFLNGVSCRLIPSDLIRAVVENPASVF